MMNSPTVNHTIPVLVAVMNPPSDTPARPPAIAVRRDEAVDDPTDERGTEAGDARDRQRDAELADGDVEAAGDDGDERSDVAVERVAAQAGERDRRDVTADRLGIRVVEGPSEHRSATVAVDLSVAIAG